MTSWILFMVLLPSTSQSGKAIATQQFDDRIACIAASTEFNKLPLSQSWCVPKAIK